MIVVKKDAVPKETKKAKPAIDVQKMSEKDELEIPAMLDRRKEKKAGVVWVIITYRIKNAILAGTH